MAHFGKAHRGVPREMTVLDKLHLMQVNRGLQREYFRRYKDPQSILEKGEFGGEGLKRQMLYNEYSEMFKENDLGELRGEHIEFMKQQQLQQ
jgi:hypothetical protein